MAFFERWLPKRRPPEPVAPEQLPPTALNRREFLKKASAAFAGAAVGAGMGHEILAASKALAEKDEATAGHGQGGPDAHADHGAEAGEHESEPSAEFEALNRQTALPVATAFAAYIADGAFFGGSFGPKSAAILNTLEGMRLATLQSQGGEQGAHAASHEFRANIQAAALAIPLVAISDFTTTAVHLDHETLFAKAQEILEENDEPEARPALEASLEEWEGHLERVNKRIVENVTEVQAITSILAPFITTYTSSAIADQLKETVLHNTYEQSYARGVIERKKAGTETDHDLIRTAAVERSNELFSGSWGFTNLETTLAANIQGGILAGDPPQLFGAAAHWGEWARLGKAEAFGLVNDAAMTYGLTATWLEKAGALQGGQKELAENFGRSYQRAVKVFGGISFGSPDKKTMAGLKAAGLKLGNAEVVSVLEAQKLLHLSVGDYAKRKAAWMGKFTEKNAGANVTDLVTTLARSAGEVVQGGLNRFERFAAGLNTGNGLGFGFGEHGQDDSGDLGKLYDQLRPDLEAHTVDIQSFSEPAPEPEYVTALQGQLETRLAATQSELQTGGANRALAKRLETLAERDPKQLEKLFEQAAPTANPAAKPAESGSAPASDHAEKPGHDATHHGLLSHAGQEVLWALGSQMPAVEPTAVLAEQAISKTFSLHGGENRSSKEKVLGAAGAAYASEAVLSSLADNIAAYLYAEKLLTNIVTKVYGKEVMEKYPGVADVVYATAIKLAEQAGALTKLGNGPNFSQRKLELRVGTKPHQEYEVVAGELPFELYTNRYAVAANILLMGGSLAWLSHELGKIEA